MNKDELEKKIKMAKYKVWFFDTFLFLLFWLTGNEYLSDWKGAFFVALMFCLFSGVYRSSANEEVNMLLFRHLTKKDED